MINQAIQESPDFTGFLTDVKGNRLQEQSRYEIALEVLEEFKEEIRDVEMNNYPEWLEYKNRS